MKRFLNLTSYMKSPLIILLVFHLLGLSKAHAQEDSIQSIDINLDYIQALDQKTFELYYAESWFLDDSLIQLDLKMPKHEIPSMSNEEILAKMELIPSQFPFTFNNIVQQHIDQFSSSRRLLIAKSLGLGSFYFPIFEEVLSRYDIPEVIKYLPIIESSLNPFAKSHAGALGLWQFMPRTGRSLGLEQNDFYDARRDLFLASEAAAKYLATLYNIYNDWLLALAAYNAGPGNVNKAIGASGGKTSYWEIWPYLPRETREYVPKFTACAFVMEYYDFYHIPVLPPKEDLFLTDTVLVKNKLSLRRIAEVIGVDSTFLQFINPALKSGIVPKTPEGYPLNLPIDYLGQFKALEDSLLVDPYLANITAEVSEVKIPDYQVYKVKSGDTLGHIAMRYGVGVSQIKKWNSLNSDKLKIGQKLVIYI